jgi:TPR repeat protein
MKRWMESPSRRRWVWAGTILVLVAALIAWNWQTLLIWATMVQDRAQPLPAFDAGKAQRLSAERRAELERELFSELWLWDTQSRRYQMPNGLKEREQRWKAMAEEGYELAYLTLQVFEPSTGHTHNPLSVLERLDELASKGDSGAMCLYGGIVWRLPVWVVDWTPQHEQAHKWMLKGAELRHPQCLIMVGAGHMSGNVLPKDLKRGLEMVFEAIHKGYGHGVISLWLRAKQLELVDTKSRRLEYCWAYHAAKYRFSDADLSLEVHISKLSPEKRPALERELEQLRQWHPSVHDCIQLTKQSFGE